MPKTNVKINKYYIQMRKSVKGETWETCCTVWERMGRLWCVGGCWGDYEFTIKCESDTKVMSQTSTATPHHIYCPLLRPFLTTYQTLKKDTTTPLPTHLRTLQSQAAKLSTVVTFTDSEQSGKKLLTKLLDEEVKHTLEKWEPSSNTCRHSSSRRVAVSRLFPVRGSWGGSGKSVNWVNQVSFVFGTFGRE
ncbi:hypothetical protein BCR33DRAFT_359297 [Rhizoclosmatium globosum]|uniref:Uncharacterized protein n=1 Tax=Rhizoclosmatium globosum TaxID=329046 RepID=A0A1Y2C1A2_9FUNG|nr:hypothetical protein BCR33DRAFT_359297 [Rhizoclosmatium globosum]|eukprot:ORY40812.1 hypothetical protein BCR33DRAFT_359297 [Rhizoclosmatium globosum]